MHRNDQGFTLIELLIVVVIIGILAAIAIPKFSQTREKAYYAAAKSDLRNLQSAQEIYYGDGQYTYAATLAQLQLTQSEGVHVAINNRGADGFGATATHNGLPGKQCGVFVGDNYSGDGAPAAEPGVVTCN